MGIDTKNVEHEIENAKQKLENAERFYKAAQSRYDGHTGYNEFMAAKTMVKRARKELKKWQRFQHNQ